MKYLHDHGRRLSTVSTLEFEIVCHQVSDPSTRAVHDRDRQPNKTVKGRRVRMDAMDIQQDSSPLRLSRAPAHPLWASPTLANVEPRSSLNTAGPQEIPTAPGYLIQSIPAFYERTGSITSSGPPGLPSPGTRAVYLDTASPILRVFPALSSLATACRITSRL